MVTETHPSDVEIWGWLDTVPGENVGDGRTSHLVAKVPQCSRYP